MLNRISNFSIRTRLYGLLVVSCGALAMVQMLALYVLFTYRVGGPVDRQITELQDFKIELRRPPRSTR